MDDYSKVTYGERDTLQLIFKDENNALLRTATGGAGGAGGLYQLFNQTMYVK